MDRRQLCQHCRKTISHLRCKIEQPTVRNGNLNSLKRGSQTLHCAVQPFHLRRCNTLRGAARILQFTAQTDQTVRTLTDQCGHGRTGPLTKEFHEQPRIVGMWCKLRNDLIKGKQSSFAVGKAQTQVAHRSGCGCGRLQDAPYGTSQRCACHGRLNARIAHQTNGRCRLFKRHARRRGNGSRVFHGLTQLAQIGVGTGEGFHQNVIHPRKLRHFQSVARQDI